jgi:triacylglycerol lipase
LSKSLPQKTVFPTARGWALFAAFLLLELALWVALTRHGVASGWWSDLTGGLLLIVLPFALRFIILLCSYRLSRVKGMALLPEQRLRGLNWWKYFLAEYWHFCKQSFAHLPFPFFFRTPCDRGEVPRFGEVIVLQHGYLHNGAVWNPLAQRVARLGYRVFTIDQPLYASIEHMADRLHARIEAICAQTGESQILLIAHSMGGLVSRAYLRRYGESRIRRLITLGSPHRGTYHAYLAFRENGKQMRPGNAWLNELAQGAPFASLTSIYSIHDTIISPQDSSRIEGAENIELTGVGHVSMFANRAVQAAILALLERDRASRTSAKSDTIHELNPTK